MFDGIINFFKKFGKTEQEEVKSKDTAKERLHLVLMQDRANVSADFLEMLKQEIIDVIKKYITVDENEIDVINKIFQATGKAKKGDEKLINSFVCASGSSPAYVFMFIEALADSAVKCGLPRKDAYEFVAQTVLGSAKLMLETGKHP